MRIRMRIKMRMEMRIMMRWRWRKRRKWGTVISDIVSGNAAKVIVLCFCSGLCTFTVTERIVFSV